MLGLAIGFIILFPIIEWDERRKFEKERGEK